MFGTLREGDHVKATRNLTTRLMDSLAGTPTVRRGRVGIIREVNPGWFRTTCTVEFSDGWGTTTVRGIDAGDLRRAYGHGEASFQRRRDIRRGWKLGLLILNLPMIVAVAWYLIRGGDPVTLALDVAMSLVGLIVELTLAHPVLALLALTLLVLTSKLRSRHPDSD